LCDTLKEDTYCLGIFLENVRGGGGRRGSRMMSIARSFNILLPIRPTIVKHLFKVIIVTTIRGLGEWYLDLIGIQFIT
jgi:hypothetical protein